MTIAFIHYSVLNKKCRNRSQEDRQETFMLRIIDFSDMIM